MCVGWEQMVHVATDDDGVRERISGHLPSSPLPRFYLILGFPLATADDLHADSHSAAVACRVCLRRDQITPINSIRSGTTKKISKVTHTMLASGNEFCDLNYQDFSANYIWLQQSRYGTTGLTNRAFLPTEFP